MKNLIISFSIFSLFSACETHEQAADDAFELVKEEKRNSPTDSIGTIEGDEAANALNEKNRKLLTVVKKVEPVKTPVVVDEWTEFRTETERKILINET